MNTYNIYFILYVYHHIHQHTLVQVALCQALIGTDKKYRTFTLQVT